MNIQTNEQMNQQYLSRKSIVWLIGQNSSSADNDKQKIETVNACVRNLEGSISNAEI